MLSIAQRSFAESVAEAAGKSIHPWPGYAAAEACLESSWGASRLVLEANNLFGLKEPHGWSGQSVNIPTNEVLHGVTVSVGASWPVFDTYAECFAERLKVLRSVEIYMEALSAETGEEFIRLLSAAWRLPTSFEVVSDIQKFTSGEYVFANSRWSTDPLRAAKVIAIYKSHPEIFVVQEQTS